ncbi:MAG: hypothetical protein RTU92_14530 [Candidatus Thorarchaeota archaeon]
MTESITGKIVFSQISKIPQTGETVGFITVRTSDNEKIRLKIDQSTEYETLRRGKEVTVEYSPLENSDFPIVRKVYMRRVPR